MKFPHYAWYPDDVLSSPWVTACSLEEEAIYRRLLDYQWKHPGCQLPDDANYLRRLCKNAKWEKIQKVLEANFIRQEAEKGKFFWKNSRIYFEFCKVLRLSEDQRSKANLRWNKEKQNATASERHMPKACLQNQNQNQNQIKEESKDIVEQKPLDQIPYKKIIEDLNQKSGKAFKADSAVTRKLIRVRWLEGFTLDDFYAVHSNMAAKWLCDEKMIPYLRPGTLYGTKFESYLNSNSSGGMSRAEYIKSCFTDGIYQRSGTNRMRDVRDITPGSNHRPETSHRRATVVDGEAAKVSESEDAEDV